MDKISKEFKCLKCLHTWNSKGALPPVLCPNHKCRSPRWQFGKGIGSYNHRSKGQITLINLTVLLGVMIVFMVFIPIITKFTTNNTLPAIASSSMDQSTQDLLTALVNAFPIILFVAICFTAFAYANPRREGQ